VSADASESPLGGSGSPLLILAGPTASGKTALALSLAEQFQGEVVSCDSVAVYRGMEIGTAKPSMEERMRVPHHLIDVFSPDDVCTAGDYSRLAREAIRSITGRGRLPIVAGGTGLYLRALIEGLFPAPARREPLRTKLRARAERHGPPYLHRILKRVDPAAAELIHANDVPKVIRAIEITLAGQEGIAPMTEQWRQPRDPLTGYRILRLGLNPPRAELYARINRRAAQMFDSGLVEETTQLVETYGFECRPLTSLGYAQAIAVLRGETTLDQAVAECAQGHRNYAKRQLTWFRKDPQIRWLEAFGSSDETQAEARALVSRFLAQPA